MAPKRPSSPTREADSTFKSPANAQRERSNRAEDGIDERGEFEDQWEDEFEEEDVAYDNAEDDDEDDGSHLGELRETGMEGDVDGRFLPVSMASRFFSRGAWTDRLGYCSM